MDIKSKEERSRNMAAIKSADTKPEVYLRKQLFKLGFRYRLHSKSIPGKPDIFLRKYNTAIFINGCFWHRHKDCKYAYTPKSNTDFWEKKFAANVERDQRQLNELSHMKIRTVIIWECTVKKMMKDNSFRISILNKITGFLQDYEENRLEL